MDRRQFLKVSGASAFAFIVPSTLLEAGSFEPDRWYHYAVSSDGKSYRYFIDGQRVDLDIVGSYGVAPEHWRMFDRLFNLLEHGSPMCAECYARHPDDRMAATLVQRI